ncbi:MAG TPA: S8 family serine peptidase, partial [Vicinamibacteria bacterium]
MAALHERAGREGTVPVIVELRLPSGARAPRGASPAALAALRSEIAQTRGRVLGRLAGRRAHVRREFRTVPFVALEADAESLQALLADDEVLQVTEDRLAAPQLAESGPLVQAPAAWAGGRDGAGHVVAVLDTGVDGGHSFLAGKVVDEACFARPGGCPNGLATQAGAGAAVPCAFTPSICRHGTHVAGIAVGAGSSFSGVARGAGLAAIQVFHPETECSPGEAVPCARAYSSDIGAALEHVYERRAEHAIAAVNLSLGSGLYASTCDADDPQLAAQVANLRGVGIATVVSAGNGGATGALSWPACLSAAVSVGSTTEADAVSPFSNAGPQLSLFAPGSSITSSVPGELFATFAGTSMAAPHVAGAFAVLRQAHPSASVSALLGALQQT